LYSSRPASASSGQRVYFDVSVADPSGNPVSGLTQADFAVEDNRRSRSIATFHEVSGGPSGEATHALLLLDAVNDTSAGELAKQVKAVEQFFAGASAPLSFSVSIALLSESGYIESDPSRDRNRLLQDLRRFASGVKVVDCSNQDSETSDNAAEAPMITEINGDTLDMMEGLEGTVPKNCRDRHVSRSLSALVKIADEQASMPGRSLLVWIGPGWPLLSGSQQVDWFRRTVRTMTSIRDAQLTLDVVSTADLEHGKDFRHVDWTDANDGAAGPKGATAANLALPVIAGQSGGVVFGKSKTMAADIAACLTGADHYYAVSFDAPPASSPDELHTVEVKVNHPDATVRAIRLYYAQP
jgi:VWFA-related protein